MFSLVRYCLAASVEQREPLARVVPQQHCYCFCSDFKEFSKIARKPAQTNWNTNTGDVNKQANQKTGDVSVVPPFVILDILRKTEMAEIC